MSHQPLLYFNLAACVLLSLAALGAALSPRVRDGVVIKVGLGLMSLGFLGVAAALAAANGFDWVVAIRGLSMVNGGLLVVVAGIGLRWRRTGRVHRIDEWINPPTVAQAARRVDAEDLQRASRL